MDKLNETLELYLIDKAPKLPVKWKEILVRFLPWLTLIFFILSLPAILFLFGLGTILAPFAYMGGISYGVNYTASMIVLAISLVLEAIAIPGLFKKSKSAWNLMYYAALINGVYNLVSFNILGAIFGTLISLYLLFQIKSYYH